MTTEPFGRQPEPVKVTLVGESVDVDFWIRKFISFANNQGADTQMMHGNIFTIYPRAVND